MMDGNKKTETQEKGNGNAEVPQVEGDGQETGEVPRAEGDRNGNAEVLQAGDGKKEVQVTEVTKPEECWQPGETEDEIKRGREQSPKVD